MANGINELLAGFQALQGGIDKLAVSTVTNRANQAVRDLQEQSSSEEDKRAGLQQIANQWAMQMSGLGQAATQIEQGKEGITGPIPTTASEAFIRGSLTGDESMTQAGQDVIDAQTKMKQTLQVTSPEAVARRDEKRQQAGINQVLRVSKTLSSPSGKSPLGRSIIKIHRIQDLRPLLKGQFDRRSIEEVAKTLDGVFSGGVGTVGGSHGLVPDFGVTRIAKLKELVTSKPAIVNAPEYIKSVTDIVDRTEAIIQSQEHFLRKQAIKGASGAASNAPNHFTNMARAQLPDDPIVSIDDKTGEVLFQSDVDVQEMSAAAEELLKLKDKREFTQILSQFKNHDSWFEFTQVNRRLAQKLAKRAR